MREQNMIYCAAMPTLRRTEPLGILLDAVGRETVGTRFMPRQLGEAMHRIYQEVLARR